MVGSDENTGSSQEQEEVHQEVKAQKEVIKKIPKNHKWWIMEAAKHARRKGEKIPHDFFHRFFED